MEKPIHHIVEQNSVEWFKLRAGVPTASSFDKIVTPAKGELSKQADSYMNHLLAESITGHVIDFQSEAMIRGHEYEDESRRAYELMTGIKTERSGFWTNAEGTVGASPDGLIGEDGSLELKNPSAKVHISYMLTKSVDREYWVQLQGQLYVCQRKYAVIVSHYPELPLVTMRVERDEEFIAKLDAALIAFTAQLAERKSELTKQYHLK